MVNLARTGAHEIPDSMVSGFRSISDIDSTIRDHFVYRPENEEILRTVRFMLAEWRERGFFEGDCDDASIFVAAVFKKVSVPVRFTAIRTQSDEFSHVYTEAWSGSGWVVVDPTVPIGTKYRYVERMNENV